MSKLRYWPLSWDYSFCMRDDCPKAKDCMRNIGHHLMKGQVRYASFVAPQEVPYGSFWDAKPFVKRQKELERAR